MHPVSYEADYQEEHNRWTTGFRLILAIPWIIVFIVYAIGSLFVTIIAWFALLILGRYPEWAREFNTGVLRYNTRISSWAGLQTDEWPPFGIGEDDAYPVRMHIDAPETQSRLKVLFRFVLVVPALFVTYAFALVQAGAAFVSWLSIVFRGYKPRAAHDAFNYAYTYSLRFNAYWGIPIYYGIPVGGFLVDTYPPLGDEGPRRKAEREALEAGQGATTPMQAQGEQVPPSAPPPPPASGS